MGSSPTRPTYWDLGAFREGATLWNRDTDTALLMTDSHADYFASNKLVVLAERRVVLSVASPRSFLDGAFAA